MSTASRVIKNTVFLYIKMGITVFISLYSTRLILAALGVSDFGIYNVVGGAIAMLGFLNSTMANATQRFMSYSLGEGDVEKCKQIFNISMVLHFVIAIITAVYSENLSQSKWIFFVGLFCIMAGFGIVVATCYFVNTATTSETSKIIISVLGGLSALLTDFVAVIYLRMNSEISSTLRDFHSRLVDTHKILMGNLIAAKIDDKELKHQTLSEIAKEVCGKVNVTK